MHSERSVSTGVDTNAQSSRHAIPSEAIACAKPLKASRSPEDVAASRHESNGEVTERCARAQHVSALVFIAVEAVS